jgi:5-methylcytosine-specific restriction endonuclease McrA
LDVALKTLKLDSSYRPIEIIDAVEGLILCMIGKAKALENYAKVVRSPSQVFKLPAVIVLQRVVKYRVNEIACNRTNVLWRDSCTCQYCGKGFASHHLTLDHVIPKSRGGGNTWQNLVTACKWCNQKKKNRTPSEANMMPLNKPIKPRPSLLRSVGKNQVSDLWKIYLWEHS